MKTIRIGNGQAFWGDTAKAPLDQVRYGELDYLMLDYLAEVTMSIMQKMRARDPEQGYARDFVPLMENLLPEILERGVKVVANAGGVNPVACARAVMEVADKLGLADRVKVGVVTGDDIMGDIDQILAAGEPLKNMETGAPLTNVRDQLASANAYFGGFPIAEALAQGADIVITGRCTDASLAVGPLIHEFGWQTDDWDKLSAATIAGHVIECGAQATGGNCMADWDQVDDMAHIGYPIAEFSEDGSFVVTKPEQMGGRVNVASITEQLLYEIGDPNEYKTADVVCDFTTIQLEQLAPNRVQVSGIKGKPAPDYYKVSMSYAGGYKTTGTLVYGWPDAVKKAEAADRIVRKRLDDLGLSFDAMHTEILGANACHGPALSGEVEADIAEVQLRLGVRSQDKQAIRRFTHEIAPLVCNGPPTVTGYFGGRSRVEEVIAYWPALMDKQYAKATVTLLGGK
ncbi:MAG: DUF1446 domain-containing protein [Gammaproteobacteria bacterium]|nr:MAG: DUF1446 domain-containing protein [Gammaproteobacteria bacterium]